MTRTSPSSKTPCAHTLLAAALAFMIAGCGREADSGSAAAETGEPIADLASQSVVHANEAASDRHPLCELVSFAEVSAAVGGTYSKLDVIDAEDLHSVDCIYLDMGDLYGGLSLRFVTTEKLRATSSTWKSAADYHEEWGRVGIVVPQLGERAVWTELPGGLLVLQGQHVVRLEAGKLDQADPQARARLEALAKQVVARLPQ